MKIPANRELNLPTARQSFNARVDAALGVKPELALPADFAAKMAALAVAQPVRRAHQLPRIGRSVALLSAVLVSIGLFAIAPYASPNLRSVAFDAELLLIAEVAAISLWIGRSAGLRRF